MVAFSIDYGTLNNRLWHQNRKLSVKVYHPRVVHVLKSLDSRLQPSYLRTINGVKGQNDSALAMIHIVSGTSDVSLGGVRLEVTVKAVSLREVLTRVERGRLAGSVYWIGAGLVLMLDIFWVLGSYRDKPSSAAPIGLYKQAYIPRTWNDFMSPSTSSWLYVCTSIYSGTEYSGLPEQALYA
jgi:hypothetical protein